MTKPPYQEQPPPPAYAPGGQPGYPPPGQPGYGPPPPQQPQSSSNVVVVSQPGNQVAPGRCRACGGGVITDNFTVCGVVLAVLFFPIGILCCFLMMEKRCGSCGVRYG